MPADYATGFYQIFIVILIAVFLAAIVAGFIIPEIGFLYLAVIGGVFALYLVARVLGWIFQGFYGDHWGEEPPIRWGNLLLLVFGIGLVFLVTKGS